MPFKAAFANGFNGFSSYVNGQCQYVTYLLYAGTTDLVGVYNGKPSIIDYKQTNKPKKTEWIHDYFIQCAAYAAAHNELFGTDIKQIIILMCSMLSGFVFGQELNCKVIINADQVQTSDRSVFKDMERAIATFMNTRKWTADSYKNHERINCTIFLNISKMPSIGNFQARAQITSGRPVFNTN